MRIVKSLYNPLHTHVTKGIKCYKSGGVGRTSCSRLLKLGLTRNVLTKCNLRTWMLVLVSYEAQAQLTAIFWVNKETAC